MYCTQMCVYIYNIYSLQWTCMSACACACACVCMCVCPYDSSYVYMIHMRCCFLFTNECTYRFYRFIWFICEHPTRWSVAPIVPPVLKSHGAFCFRKQDETKKRKHNPSQHQFKAVWPGRSLELRNLRTSFWTKICDLLTPGDFT